MVSKEQIMIKTKKMKKTFLALTVAFIFFNFFLSLTLNLFSLSKREENKYFITVELKSNVSPENRKKIERDLLSMSEVNKVSFYGRDKAFVKLQKDLNLSIPKSENPLPDTFFLYFKDIKSIEKIQEGIEKEEGVKEFFIDHSYIENVQKRVILYNQITVLSSVLLVIPSILLIYFIFKTACGYEILRSHLLNSESKLLEKSAKIYNIILSFLASIIGTLIYFNIYLYARNKFLKIDADLFLLSFFEILSYHLIGVIICNLIAWITPGQLISKRSVEE